MAIIIKTTGKAIPKKIMHNSDFPASLDTSDEWIRSHTGIGSRYIASQEDTSASLGAEACKQVLANENLNPQDIDLIICATATAEYQGFPSNACLIQKELGAKNAACFISQVFLPKKKNTGNRIFSMNIKRSTAKPILKISNR